MRKHLSGFGALAVLAAFALAAAAPAQAQQTAEELAKKLANPVASMVSLPMQNNFELDYRGSEIDGGYKWLMNVQPVIPITLGKNWNLISRTILPVVSQGNVYGTGTSQFGLGDTLQSLFFSPAAPSKKLGLIWGAGPVILIPTSTSDLLGAGKWAVGPTLVVLKQTGPWTFGLLANQIWGGNSTVKIDSMYLQPFLGKTYKGGFGWVLNTEFTRNWAVKSSVGAVNLTFAQIAKVIGQLVQFGFGPKFWYGDAPVRARWGIRVNVVLLWAK